MNGVDLAEWALTHRPSIAVLVTTGGTDNLPPSSTRANFGEAVYGRRIAEPRQTGRLRSRQRSRNWRGASRPLGPGINLFRSAREQHAWLDLLVRPPLARLRSRRRLTCR
jgi:hypothetical protein